MSPKQFLRHYAERLPSVEVNSTFYNLPAESTVTGWAEATPPGFRFAVKLNRNLGQLGTFCERVRLLGDRLGPIRIVVPRARDDGHLSFLLGSLDPELAYAFDFRHESWDGVDPILAEAGAVRVGALEATAPFRYLRFRDPPYDDDALAGIGETIRPLLAEGLDVYAYFRHEDEPTAPAYAARLLELVSSGTRTVSDA